MTLRAFKVVAGNVFLALATLGAIGVSMMAAQAQSLKSTSQPDVTALLNSGYTIVAASSDGQSQFLYFAGTDASGKKKAYACQLQFGPGGGFHGCIVLP